MSDHHQPGPGSEPEPGSGPEAGWPTPPQSGYPPPGQAPYPPPTGQPPFVAGGTTIGANRQSQKTVVALVLSLTAGAILIFGFCCYPITMVTIPMGGIGAYLGRQETQAIDAGQVDQSNRSMAQAAFIIGLIVAILSALYLAVIAALVLVGLTVPA